MQSRQHIDPHGHASDERALQSFWRGLTILRRLGNGGEQRGLDEAEIAGGKTGTFYVSTSFAGVRSVGGSQPAPTAHPSPQSMLPIQTARCDSRSVGSDGLPSPPSTRGSWS